MALQYRKEIGFVAHAHNRLYEGRYLPIEIGIVQVLSEGTEERERKALLLTVDNSSRYVTPKDRRVNRVASNRCHGLPSSFEGRYSKEEAEKRALEFVGQELVAVKGDAAKSYFESLGMRCVELKTQVYGDCPKHEELDHSDWLPYDHTDHRDEWKCSRVISHLFAKYIEKRRSEDRDSWDEEWEVGSGEPIPPPVPVDEPSSSTRDEEWAVGSGEPIPPPVPASADNLISIDLQSLRSCTMERIELRKNGFKFVINF